MNRATLITFMESADVLVRRDKIVRISRNWIKVAMEAEALPELFTLVRKLVRQGKVVTFQHPRVTLTIHPGGNKKRRIK